MLLTPDERKAQTRQLWRTCFDDSEDFLDIYFEEKYTDERNLTLQPNGAVAAALQLLPYRMTFYGRGLHAGYISGLAVQPEERDKGLAAKLLRQAHQELYKQGGVFSFLIPSSDELRHFYERPEHGAYWTSTFRQEVELTIDEATDDRVEVTQPDEWGTDLYVFYHTYAAFDFMLHPSEQDFFAAVETCDLDGGYVLVARRKRRIVGLCLAAPEADGRLVVRSLLVMNNGVKAAFIARLKALAGVDKVYVRVPSPGGAKTARPYAMARVINVERLLRTVLRVHPDFQLHIGVDGDLDIPTNNGFYLLRDGQLTITDLRPDTIVTPGGLAAMFLGAQPTYVEMMLDE